MTGRPTKNSFIAVGRIAGPIGIRGELKVEVLTDFPQRFETGSKLFLAEKPVTVQGARVSGRDRLIVSLKEIHTRTDADAIPRGATLDIREEDAIPLPDGAYYRFQLIGLQAVTDPDGDVIGAVEDVLETGVNDVLIVRAPGKPETLIPNTPEIVTVDMDGGRILVQPVEGLFVESKPELVERTGPPPRRRRRRRNR